MSRKRIFALIAVLGFMAVASSAAWLAGSFIESPAESAARTAPPTPSPILVPVEERVLRSEIVTRGTGRYGLPLPIALAPSSLKPTAGLITTVPVPNSQVEEGDVLLTVSGRPVFVLAGDIPGYRDLVPGKAGDDVLQLERALERLGFDPGEIDGSYDERTSAAVAAWYEASGWEPFSPTPEQLARLNTLERELGDAVKNRVAAGAAAMAAGPAVDAARATADHNLRMARAELETRKASQRTLAARGADGVPLAVQSERARAEHATTAAEAQVAATIAERARVVLDPRQPATARAAADARLELAQAAALKTELESELAVQAAERDAQLAAERYQLAAAAVKSAELAGETSVQAALDSRKVAVLGAQLAADRADRLAHEVEAARRRLGVQVPVDEVVFVRTLPARVKEVTAQIGDPARGPILAVTDNQLSIDSSLTLEAAPLVQPGMKVDIDEQALGIEARGVVKRVADTPGTRGVDGYHVYFEVEVAETPKPLAGFSLRLKIPIESTEGAVTTVPVSALSLSADGTSRIQVESNGGLHYMEVKPGLSAQGFVEVTPVDGALSPGQLVVVGFDNPEI